MATITHSGIEYTVDHAVKGSDFIHGYDESGKIIVSFDGITDFSDFTFDGEYMEPTDCLEEPCNSVRYHDNSFKRPDGTAIMPVYGYGTEDLIAGESQLETGKLYFVYE